MKRTIQEANTTLAMRESAVRRIREDVGKLQAEISEIITQALQTKLIIEQLAQGQQHIDINYHKNATNDYVEYQNTDQPTAYQESGKFHRLKRS